MITTRKTDIDAIESRFLLLESRITDLESAIHEFIKRNSWPGNLKLVTPIKSPQQWRSVLPPNT